MYHPTRRTLEETVDHLNTLKKQHDELTKKHANLEEEHEKLQKINENLKLERAESLLAMKKKDRLIARVVH